MNENMQIRLEDPLRDLLNDCIEVSEHCLGSSNFLWHAQPWLSTLQTVCPDSDIRMYMASGYILAALDRPDLAAQKFNWAGILNLEREHE